MSEKLKSLVLGDLVIEVPIIQGGMGVKVSTASLVSAVADCGGAGTIASVGLGYGTDENETNYIQASINGLRKEIREARKMSDGVIGVNAMVALSNYEDLVRIADEEKVDFIASGAGLPLKLPGLVKNPSTKLIPIVSSGRALKVIIRSWSKKYNRFPDAVIVEGPMAGGHLGFKSEDLKSGEVGKLEDLVKEVIDTVKEVEEKENVKIPVIAAGGIFNGKDIAKFLKMGASGVQMGTRFAATHECAVSKEFKDLYVSSKDGDVMIIDSPVGMPGRAIRNKFMEKVVLGEKVPFRCNYKCLRTCDPRTVPYCIAKALFNAVNGDIDNAVVFSGSNVTRVDKIVSVKELMDELVSETLAELKK